MNDDNPLELEEMAEKELASGELITLAKVELGYDVDCWTKDGENRWNRFFLRDQLEQAQAEYDRWN